MLNVVSNKSFSRALFAAGAIFNSALPLGATQPPSGGGSSPYPSSPNPGVNSVFTYGQARLQPEYGDGAPAVGETVTLSNGVQITRLTDVNSAPGASDLFIVYSRYSPENTDGNKFLGFGADSTSSYAFNRDGTLLGALKHTSGADIGENHEVRWDISGLHPNRVYYRYGMGFYMIDDVRNPQPVIVRDFSSVAPNSTQIYNDVEGDCSDSSDRWGWMATHYDGSNTVVDAYISYEISSDTFYIKTPADMSGSNLSSEADKSHFSYRPNMVEISPDGNWFVMHHDRKWDDSSYGGNGAAWVDTWYDGAWAWPFDLDFNAESPRKISVTSTHSGWAWSASGSQYFVSQNSRTDKLDAVALEDPDGWANRLIVGGHAEIGWGSGWHYGKMPPSHADWQFVNNYSNFDSSNYNNSGYGHDQLWFSQMRDQSTGKHVHIPICHNHNKYVSDYRDEAPAAINRHGNRIYMSINWGGATTRRDIYLVSISDNWLADANAYAAAL
ncbi:MAG: hypothetical protein K6L75_02540 [Cellvibrionaceae bacterium]